MNMFKPTKAQSFEEYFELLPPERRKILETIRQLIQKTVPELKPVFVSNMPGFGTFKYKNYKGEVGDWPTIAIASQKNYLSIYVCSIDGNQYLAEKYKDKLGNVNVGKSCIRFKKIEDLNLEVLAKILTIAAKKPGLEKK